jgi:hypothetical protein
VVTRSTSRDGWPGAEAKAKRAQAEREPANLASHRPITAAEIEALLAQVPAKLEMLAGADVSARQRLYSELGLRLTYHAENQVVRVEARPPWGFDRVEGGLSHIRHARQYSISPQPDRADNLPQYDGFDGINMYKQMVRTSLLSAEPIK